MAVEVGEGYRLLEPFEVVTGSDDYSYIGTSYGWVNCRFGGFTDGLTVREFRDTRDHIMFRRRIKSPKNPSTSPEVRGNQSILAEADQIAGESRSRDYGHPYDNHKRIADGWNIQLAGKLNAPITPREAALMMVWLKLARECNTEKRDNLIDIAGYVKCADMIDQRQKELRCESDS